MRFTSSPPNQGPSNAYYPQSQHAPRAAHGNPYGQAQFQSFGAGSQGGPVRGGPASGPQMQQPGLDFAQWGVNPATAQLGMQLGQSAVAAGQEYVQKNVRGLLA